MGFQPLKLQGLKARFEALAIVGPEGPPPLPSAVLGYGLISWVAASPRCAAYILDMKKLPKPKPFTSSKEVKRRARILQGQARPSLLHANRKKKPPKYPEKDALLAE